MDGQNRIGFSKSSQNNNTFTAVNPTNQQPLPVDFAIATDNEADAALQLAEKAYQLYRKKTGSEKGAFLDAIADEIENLGDELIQRAAAESGLPEARITGERGRTTGQLRLFADLLKEGSWVDASIDKAMPDRAPVPKPDIRRMLQPVGPVVVFSASNFPLAFAAAGGDSASALAAGNPVIVKAHPSHPGANQLAADAILRAAEHTGMPDGVFSTLYDDGYQTGLTLVNHALTKSVAFTGSLQGGMALFREAQSRETPIPVFAEMGSTNPVLLLPEYLKSNPESLATQLADSITLGVGQFCTNPGLLVAIDSPETGQFINMLGEVISKSIPATMLNQGICTSYNTKINEVERFEGLRIVARSSQDVQGNEGRPTVATIPFSKFSDNPTLHEELFGPYSLVVVCENREELEAFVESVSGQLTATLFANDQDVGAFKNLITKLENKVGRLIFNNVPTGVEVCHALQHGGPFPASTDSRFTSIGTDAVKRFVRPVAYQNAPQSALPAELRDGNPLKIWRRIDGVLTKD